MNEIEQILHEIIDQVDQQLKNEEKNQLLKEFQLLSEQVEQRLEIIENTERELDRWRDQQLQKNRIFWDEYRRQVENYSSSRIRTLQYEYTINQINNQSILKRLKFAKYLSENLDQYREQLIQFIDPAIVHFISSEQFTDQYQSCLSNSHFTNELFQQLSSLDQFDLSFFQH